jgi:lipid A 4'-phosphatase
LSTRASGLLREHLDWCVLATAVLLFSLWPRIDLWVSGQFFEAAAGKFQTGALWAQVLYRGTDWISTLVSLVIVLIFAFAWRVPRRAARRTHRKAGFLLLSFLLGPGLLVNEGFKEHWGRARPRDVQEFQGTQLFTPAIRPSAQCDTNCSFVSGHAAIGFAPLSLAWVTRWRLGWVLLGVVAGGAVGLARIAMGGHFLSDVVFSGLVVWFSARTAAWIFVRRRPGWRELKGLRGFRGSRDRDAQIPP